MTDRSKLTPDQRATLDRVDRKAAEANAGTHELINEAKVAKARRDAGQITDANLEAVIRDGRERSRPKPPTPEGQRLIDAWDQIKADRPES